MPDATPSSLAGDDRAISVERPVVWVVAVLAVVAIAGSVYLYGEDVRRDVPDADFDVSFDAETGTVTVEHAGGDAITDRVTRELAVVLVDESANARSRVVWASDHPGLTQRGSGYPVDEGDALTIDDPTVDADGDENVLDAERSVGFPIAEADTVRVVWTGDRQGGAPETATVGNATVG